MNTYLFCKDCTKQNFWTGLISISSVSEKKNETHTHTPDGSLLFHAATRDISNVLTDHLKPIQIMAAHGVNPSMPEGTDLELLAPHPATTASWSHFLCRADVLKGGSKREREGWEKRGRLWILYVQTSVSQLGLPDDPCIQVSVAVNPLSINCF